MSDIKFIRKNGRIIPIGPRGVAHAGSMASRTAKASAHFATRNLKTSVKPHKGLSFTGAATSIASGFISGATMFSRGKKFWAGQAASVGLDFLAPTLTASSYVGKGRLKERAKGAAKDAARNEMLGYAALGATLLATKSSRMKSLVYARKGYRLVKSGIGFVAKAVL